MSWNSAPLGPVAISALEDALAQMTFYGPDSPEHQEQIAAAKQAALAIARSGAVGDPATARVYVSLSGHGNPGHAPQPGWANDVVTLNVNQAAPEPAITPTPTPTMSALAELVVEPVVE